MRWSLFLITEFGMFHAHLAFQFNCTVGQLWCISYLFLKDLIL